MAITTEETFERLVESHRRGLHAHCYRMLGSLHDAEDAYQEAMLRAWRALPRLREDAAARTWLYRIATNVCLNAIARRPRRVLPADYGPAWSAADGTGEPTQESLWLEPYPDSELESGYAAPEARYEQREAVELAFVAALQHLPAQQRSVLIMRDVLGFSGAEVAEALGTNANAVYSALQRAHKTVDERLPARSQQATLRALGDAGLREVVAGYIDAWERHDIDALAAKLAEDAALTMPPTPTWYRGRDAIASSLRARPLADRHRWRVIPTRANGQPAFGHYLWTHDAQAFLAREVALLTLDGDQITEITVFREPGLLARFGLPDTL